MDGIQFIVVKLGEEFYGINIKYVENIVRMQHITRVPLIQNHIKGVINLRGEVIPVMSIRLKMGLEDDEITKLTRIIIIKLEHHGTVGIMVDSVKEVVTLTSDQIEKMSHEVSEDTTNFVAGVGKVEEGLISLLDLNVVVYEPEA